MTDGINLGIEGLGPATLLDRGGSAYVYLAEQLAFGRKVAVKVLFQALEDPDTFRRFERECRAIGAVSDHPNIVVVHGRGLTEDDRPYLIMEHRQGGSLADQIEERGRFTEVETVQIGKKIAQALGVAHGAGVIHRDVKPGNILLSQYGEPALADFGIARVDGASKTTAGILTASVNHASREVLNGGEATIQSDIYSLGSTLFALATGRAPFVSPSDDSVWTLINRVVTTDPPDASQFGVSAPLAEVLRLALAHDVGSRYQTADHLAQALEDLASGKGTVTNRTADTEQFLVDGGATTSRYPNKVSNPDGLPAGQSSVDSASESANPPVNASTNAVTGPSHDPAQPGSKIPMIAPINAGSREAKSERRPLLITAVGAGAILLLAAVAWFAIPQLQGAADQAQSSAEEGSDDNDEYLLSSSESSDDSEATTVGPTLDVRQAQIGPLVVDRRYALSLIDSSGEREIASIDDRQYQILLDGEAVTDLEDSVPVFFPTSPGRFELTVEVVDETTSVISSGVDIYISPGPPEPGYRVNLASVRSVPSNWPQALRQFDQLLDAGHSELKLSLSSRGEQDGLPFWNFYVDGFGEDRSKAQAYCDERDLGPDQCFPGRVTGSAAES